MAPRLLLDAITDVPGIKVGHWTDRRAATGCTVVLYEEGAVGGADVRGGAPGTYLTEFLRPGNLEMDVHAVLLTGGSAFGLEAAFGVMRWCEEHGIGDEFGGVRVPIVAGAVIFDLNIGRGDVRPNAAAGYAAARAAHGGRVRQGSVGAGTGATVAKLLGPGRRLKGGLGTAAEGFGDGLIVGALFVVNAVGEVVDSLDGSVVAAPRGDDGGFVDSLEELRRRGDGPVGGNTTIGVVATNARLTRERAARLAAVCHDGLARAVRPAHTPVDGDTIFVLATGERTLPPGSDVALEAFACRAVERSVVNGVRAATSLAGVPSVSDWLRSGGAGAAEQ